MKRWKSIPNYSLLKDFTDSQPMLHQGGSKTLMKLMTSRNMKKLKAFLIRLYIIKMVLQTWTTHQPRKLLVAVSVGTLKQSLKIHYSQLASAQDLSGTFTLNA